MKPRTLAVLLESVRELIETSWIDDGRPRVGLSAFDDLGQTYKQIMQEAADGIR
jgi:hypothetical protein